MKAQQKLGCDLHRGAEISNEPQCLWKQFYLIWPQPHPPQPRLLHIPRLFFTSFLLLPTSKQKSSMKNSNIIA